MGGKFASCCLAMREKFGYSYISCLSCVSEIHSFELHGMYQFVLKVLSEFSVFFSFIYIISYVRKMEWSIG